jgi:glutamate N-acetyltransferase/amino-acid N-acetyltransferase
MTGQPPTPGAAPGSGPVAPTGGPSQQPAGSATKAAGPAGTEALSWRRVEGNVTSPRGFVAGAVACGLKASGNLDLTLVASDRPATAAGTFTRNLVKAAPVLLCQEYLAGGRAQAVVTNSGQANACTGEEGLASARRMSAAAARRLGLQPSDVLVLSTGVIGVLPALEKILPAIEQLELSPGGGEVASRAIMTTDTQPKTAAATLDLPGGITATLGGMAKGSGMIRPNMATMLGVLTTDVALTPDHAAAALRSVVDRTFNMVSVDGDTSTNDTVLLLANGACGAPPLQPGTPQAAAFEAALEGVCRDLARQIARDGEGATKLIECRVTGARDEEEARLVAHAVIGSSLTKSAMFGNDPNWGRIVCAAGYSGAAIEPQRTRLTLQGIVLFQDGRPLPFDRAAASAALRSPDVLIELDLGHGEASATGWGCDLTYKYVEINAEYTT